MGRRRLGAMESHTPPGGPQEVSGDHLSHEEEMMIIVKKEACQQSYVVPGERQKEGPSLTLKTVIAACRVHVVGAGV